jgi:hypothetical protein
MAARLEAQTETIEKDIELRARISLPMNLQSGYTLDLVHCFQLLEWLDSSHLTTQARGSLWDPRPTNAKHRTHQGRFS